MEHTITFTYERDTKNKYRYQEDGDDLMIGTLYVSKSAFKERPNKVQVTLKGLD